MGYCCFNLVSAYSLIHNFDEENPPCPPLRKGVEENYTLRKGVEETIKKASRCEAF